MEEAKNLGEQEPIEEIEKQIDALVDQSFQEYEDYLNSDDFKNEEYRHKGALFPIISYTRDNISHACNVPRNSWLGLIKATNFYCELSTLAKKIAEFSKINHGIENENFYSAYATYAFLKKVGTEFCPDLTDEQRDIVLEYLLDNAKQAIRGFHDVDPEIMEKFKPIFEQFPSQIISYFQTFENSFKTLIKSRCGLLHNDNYSSLANGCVLIFGLQSVGKVDPEKRSTNDETDYDRMVRLYDNDEFKSHVQTQLEAFKNQQ